MRWYDYSATSYELLSEAHKASASSFKCEEPSAGWSPGEEEGALRLEDEEGVGYTYTDPWDDSQHTEAIQVNYCLL